MVASRAELAQFNEGVRAWAERFQPARVRRFALVMGLSADVVTHTHYKSYDAIAASYRKQHKKTIGYNTVWRYLRLLEDGGVITIERRKWGPGDEKPHVQRSNLYTVQFNRVMVQGRTVNHGFYQAIGVKMEPGVESGVEFGLEPGVEPGVEY